jgi:hypothetical protein
MDGIPDPVIGDLDDKRLIKRMMWLGADGNIILRIEPETVGH